jgi:methyl-accepting chemotaxis protein
MRTCKHRGRCSIFVRLLLALIVTMFAMHLILAALFGRLFNNGITDTLESNIQNYTEYLIQDIGSPPDTIKVNRYTSKFDFQYCYESDDMTWASDPAMPTIEHVLANPGHRVPGPTSTWRQNFLVTHPDGSRALIRWTPGSFDNTHRKFFYMALAVVTLIFMMSHGYTRRVLKPIRLLQKGVDKVRDGDLDTKVPIIREDELGQLTETFNDMTRRIK